jgi:hypothetical protein
LDRGGTDIRNIIHNHVRHVGKRRSVSGGKPESLI